MSNENQVLQKHKTYRMIINLEQLPEPIFRAIFKYLEYKIILTVLRNVCKKLTEHVDSYVKIMGIFMLTGNNVNPAKVIYIFKNTENEIEGLYERATGCPFRNSCTIRTTEKETFDLVLNDKVLCCNHQYGLRN